MKNAINLTKQHMDSKYTRPANVHGCILSYFYINDNFGLLDY